jgi:hypothetical protein
MHFVALLCAFLLCPAPHARAAEGIPKDARPVIPVTWLVKRISVAEAEAEHRGINDERAQRSPELARPFGGLNAQWESLKAEMKPGDEIWTFASPADSWKNLAGRAGIALVREGIPIMSIVTLLN